MLQPPPLRPVISVGSLKQALAAVPDDHGLVPSQVYDLFVVDEGGHNKGYISAAGELHWWPAERGWPSAGDPGSAEAPGLGDNTRRPESDVEPDRQPAA